MNLDESFQVGNISSNTRAKSALPSEAAKKVLKLNEIHFGTEAIRQLDLILDKFMRIIILEFQSGKKSKDTDSINLMDYT